MYMKLSLKGGKALTLENINVKIKVQWEWLFEVVNFVATTRRWYDRGNPRDAGGCYACQITALKSTLYFTGCFVFYAANMLPNCCLTNHNKSITMVISSLYVGADKWLYNGVYRCF